MISKHSTNSSNGSDDEDQPLLHNRSPEQQQACIILNGLEDPIVGINTIDNEERETQPLLDEYNVKPSLSCFLLCTNMPARYTIAIWAFFGFFCSYAMRVNLSVAIVAMVSKSNI
jgi:hypothetical protein